MRLLLDTNIFLEILLDQDRAHESRRLLENVRQHELFISDYALHSIGMQLFKREMHDIFDLFIKETFDTVGVE